jgi:hypothetical protein
MAMLGGFPSTGPVTYDGPRGLAEIGARATCRGEMLEWRPDWRIRNRWDIYEGRREEWQEIDDMALPAYHQNILRRSGSRFECIACGETWYDAIHEALTRAYSPLDAWSAK